MANDNQGPKGDKGDKGDRGDQGPQGPPGPPGKDGNCVVTCCRCDDRGGPHVDPFGPLTTEQLAHLVCCVLEHTRPVMASENSASDPTVLAARRMAAQKSMELMQ